jgi:hypothetical protein
MTATAMTTAREQAQPNPAAIAHSSRHRMRSIWAVFAGFVAVVVLSLGTDQVLHVLNVYPPWGQPMYDPALNLLALGYRTVYTIIGGYIAARLAPRAPMRHALALGIIGSVVGLAGAIATIPMNLGPAWYPIALALLGIPCTWLGALLYNKKR